MDTASKTNLGFVKIDLGVWTSTRKDAMSSSSLKANEAHFALTNNKGLVLISECQN